ncbi:hypothetical protein [Chrysiogenes arsenatis]|uniref:hypothetical protein n=1 Tax=Chrysiogenes arsenatis TaxID=309797 RepID=UPI00041471A6|nr:hypothetical protein [Chrysiogenes arsenatis]
MLKGAALADYRRRKDQVAERDAAIKERLAAQQIAGNLSVVDNKGQAGLAKQKLSNEGGYSIQQLSNTGNIDRQTLENKGAIDTQTLANNSAQRITQMNNNTRMGVNNANINSAHALATFNNNNSMNEVAARNAHAQSIANQEAAFKLLIGGYEPEQANSVMQTPAGQVPNIARFTQPTKPAEKGTFSVYTDPITSAPTVYNTATGELGSQARVKDNKDNPDGTTETRYGNYARPDTSAPSVSAPSDELLQSAIAPQMKKKKPAPKIGVYENSWLQNWQLRLPEPHINQGIYERGY